MNGYGFQNIEFMNGGECFKNLSRTSVSKSIGRDPRGLFHRIIIKCDRFLKPCYLEMGGHSPDYCFLQSDHFLFVLGMVMDEMDQPCFPQLKQKPVAKILFQKILINVW
jgi:hypothetical protein